MSDKQNAKRDREKSARWGDEDDDLSAILRMWLLLNTGSQGGDGSPGSDGSQGTIYVGIEGSSQSPVANARQVGPADPREVIRVTVLLRPEHLEEMPNAVQTPNMSERQYISRSELAQHTGASSAAAERVVRFAADNNLTVKEVRPETRMVRLEGSVQAMSSAFRVTLVTFEAAGQRFRDHIDPIQIPDDISDDVEAVVGLDNRPQLTPRIQTLSEQGKTGSLGPPASYPPAQVAEMYDFPGTYTGAGQCIAILEFGGGYTKHDLAAFFAENGISPPPHVVAIGVDGATNSPGTDQGADGEVMLDIEVAGSIAPAARIAVYFASNTSDGFVRALAAAIQDEQNQPTAISISWGGAEETWSTPVRNAMDRFFADAAYLGITVLAAAGDDGSRDGIDDGRVHVDYPAASPFVLACGGTQIQVSGGMITNEVVWNNGEQDGAGGGGVSRKFPLPAYQRASDVPPSANPAHQNGRGVPDWAANASPLSGYAIRLVGGQTEPVGGTSAVAPLFASLVTLIAQAVSKPLGFIHPVLYGRAAALGAFSDITTGTNNITGLLPGYDATPGWDPCTGLGSPDGQLLLKAFQ
jgi:kumamolisin